MKTAVSLHMKNQNLTVSINNQCLDHEGAQPYPVMKLIQHDGDVTIFPEYEQIMQMYATLGAFIVDNPDKFSKNNVAEERVTLETYSTQKTFTDTIKFSVPRAWLNQFLDDEGWGELNDYLVECTYDDNEWVAQHAKNDNVYKFEKMKMEEIKND